MSLWDFLWDLGTWASPWNVLPPPPLVLEESVADDADELAALHAGSFAGSAWSAADLLALLREETVFGLVARRANVFGTRSIVGFVLVRAVADEAEILTVAVASSHRRRGIGGSLVEEAMRRLYRDRVAVLFLEVDAGNGAALALYRKLRFTKVGERRGYYAHGTQPGATALVMRADLR